MVYFIVLVYLYICANIKRLRESKFIYLLTFIIFWIFAGTSFSGQDKLGYKAMYDVIPIITKLNVIQVTDKGYYLLNSLLKFLNKDFKFFLFIYSFVGNFIYFKALKKYSKILNLNRYDCLIYYYCILYFFLNFSYLRQFYSAVIFFYSFIYIYKNKFFKYCLCILIASLFHISALFLLILYPILRIKEIKKVILITLLGFTSLRILIEYLRKIPYFSKINLYIFQSSFSIVGFIERTFLVLLILYYIYLNRDLLFKEIKINNIIKALVKLYFIFYIAIQTTYSYTTIFYRLNNYFFIIFQLLIPIILFNILRSRRITTLAMLIYGLLSMTYFTFYKSEMRVHYIPYKTMLLKSSDEFINTEEEKTNYFFQKKLFETLIY